MKIAAIISCTLGAKPFRNDATELDDEILFFNSQNFTDDVTMTSLAGAQERSFFATAKLYQMTQLYMMLNGHPRDILGIRFRNSALLHHQLI